MQHMEYRTRKQRRLKNSDLYTFILANIYLLYNICIYFLEVTNEGNAGHYLQDKVYLYVIIINIVKKITTVYEIYINFKTSKHTMKQF